MTARRRNSPSAVNSERKTTHRLTRSCVVVAVSLNAGTRNCGGGPGFGPTANVKAPRTGCPSAEIVRQKTRYQPSERRCSGVTSVSGEPGAERGSPAVTCRPEASVTETIAKRATTGSVYVSVTCSGATLTVPLAAGTVFSSAACAQAAPGSTSAPADTSPSTRG